MKRLTTVVAVALACLLAGSCLAEDSGRDKLSVKASATEVHLQWFERKPVIVERGTPNGPFQQLGIAQEGEYRDPVIDAHQTYIYRVTPVSDMTAAVAVTVGPPPAGYSQAAVNPKQNNANISDLFGEYVCMALDQNGDPMLAYVWVNPSGNTNLNPPNSDTSIYFVSWNRSTNSYNAPVKIAVTGDIEGAGGYDDFYYPLALARDPVNNTLGIAYRSYSSNGGPLTAGGTAYVNIAFSTDGGQTWASQQLASSPLVTSDYCCIDLALYNGAVYEMYYVGSPLNSPLPDGPLELATGTETTAANTWSIQHSYQVSGYPYVEMYYSLALDSTGTPAVVISRAPNNTGTGTVSTYFWRPIANTIAEVLTDNGFGQGGAGDSQNYAVRLTFYGTEPRIVYNGARNNSFNNAQQVWFASSTTGAAGTWTVTNVPANSGADEIGAPFGIAVGSVGQVMVATTIGGGSGTGCGEKTSIDLALTTDLSTWTVCGMGGATSPDISSLYPTVRYGVNDGLFVSFQEPVDGDPLPNGVYVWSQYANGPCSYSLATNSQTIGPAAGSDSFVLNAGSGCSWINYSDTSWLTITSPASASGMATITFSATANTSNSARVGTLTVAGITYTVTQSAGATAPAAFFTGEDPLGSGVYYLQFPDGNLFGYYNLTNFPIFYHYDMGFEAFVDGGNGAAYLYDFTSGHWWYTSPALFPYLYDFTLNSWLYYFPSTNPGHYTSNPRYFSNLTTGKVLMM